MRSIRAGIVAMMLVGLALLALPAFAQDSLTPGTPVNGTLSGDSATYTINAGAGQMITLKVESTDFDAQVAIVDANGNELARDDDSGGDTNALLAYMPQAGGTFTVVVSAWSGGDGAFTLTPETITPTVVEPGQTGSVAMANSSAAFASFSGTASGALNIFATNSDDVDLRLTLYGPDGQEVARDDDSGPGMSPYLRRVALPADGVYLVRISPAFSDPVTTTVDLTIEPTEPVFLSAAPQQAILSEDGLSLEIFSLEATAGTTYRIVVANEGGTRIRLELTGTDDYFNPSLNVDAAARVAWDYTANINGVLRLIVYADYFGEEGTYSVWLEPVE